MILLLLLLLLWMTRSNRTQRYDQTSGQELASHQADLPLAPASQTQLMTAYPQLLGIGIDEGAAVVVRGERREVVGRSKVAVRSLKAGETVREVAARE